ncbi:hypothetical protein [Nocardioides pinisoli]|uniref:DUF4352 domain-containing protein n=1 Tax=Nocardioides pinisoli TaxID=2950279 RepID=A0ABT1L2K3_9ACTN|nr:hypothetical protein [Nocardioides pinisoli]MCP3423819.1 hypothetical protein [Nocardioides pinisoli]
MGYPEHAAPTAPAPSPRAGAHVAAATDEESSNRNVLVGAGVGALLLILVVGGVLFSVLGDDGDGSTAAAKSGKTLRGIAVLFDTDGSVEGSWDDCEGTDGYDDFTSGMSLKITGTNDEIVGSGDVVNVTESNIDDVAQAELDGDNALGMDATTHEEATAELRDMLETGEGMSCILYFEAAIEPSDYYSVELGSRGALNFSKADLEESGYVVGYSLGDL